MNLPTGALALLVLALPLAASPQSNTVPGLDNKLGILGAISVRGRTGFYPDGTNGLGISTTACNIGSVGIGWNAPMDENHPTIAFLIAREENGRLEQISGRSYVKHGFYATNQSQCSSCPFGGGNVLQPGCSDTYSTGNNSDHYYLGPPEEIDPWLGKWVAQCSHFDRGEPPAPPPWDCDGVRSLTQSQASALGPVGHRVAVTDADLARPGATFWFAAQYVIAGEAESLRGDDLGSQRFQPHWNGSSWSTAALGGLQHGSVLQRWSGAAVSSATAGADDGRVYAAVVATTPEACLFHYEYAIHVRDSRRGVGELRIPLAPGASVRNAGFRDIDGDPANDWTATVSGGELVFSTASNPVEWNTIYNFWFDSDAAPAAGDLALAPFLAGGPASFTIASSVPTGEVCYLPSSYCTAKTNSQGCTPHMSSSGTPSASQWGPFLIEADDVLNNKPGLLFYGFAEGAAPFQGGTLCVAPPTRRTGTQSSGGNPPPNDCSGRFSMDFNLRIQFGIDPALVAGETVYSQYWSRDPADPAGFGTSLTDGLRFTIQP